MVCSLTGYSPDQWAIVDAASTDYAKMKVLDLKSEAKSRGIKVKSGTKKQGVINLLVAHDNDTTRKQFKQLDDFLDKPMNKGDSLPCVHPFYATNFNYIDRFNRFFYMLNYPHKMCSREAVIAWSVLQVLFVDAWSLWCSLCEHQQIIPFTEKWIEALWAD